MKRFLVLLVIFAFCLSVCACSNDSTIQHTTASNTQGSTGVTESVEQQVTTSTELISIETGLSIDELKQFASSSGVDKYSETALGNGLTSFSFSEITGEYKGTMANNEVLEFSIDIETVKANTAEEFIELAYIGFNNFGQLTWNQSFSALSVMYIMEIYVMLGGDGDITLAEATSVIMDSTTLSINNWTIASAFDADNDHLKIIVVFEQ